MSPITLLAVVALGSPLPAGSPADAAERPACEMSLAGDWSIRVTARLPEGEKGKAPRETTATLAVDPPERVTVLAEEIKSLPIFQPHAGGWMKGAQLAGVRAQETTTPGLLDRESLVLRAGPSSESETFRAGEDYDVDLAWGTVGRRPGGRIREGRPVTASYRYTPLRLDVVVATAAGRLEVRKGTPRAAAPVPPEILEGEQHLGNIWLPGPLPRLGPEHLFPILEMKYPEAPKPTPTVAERLLPRTMKKLRAGEPIRILAWGDSVTVGTYVPDPARERWQEQFVARLRERFPSAKMELVTEAWGGRSTESYLAEPPGSEHNYREKVLGARPDLVISEFVNDAGLGPQQVAERYGKLLSDFRSIGAEWIILTPHYVRPDWMGLDRERDVDDDPRPYVDGLRRFSAREGVALADAAKRYGRLWRQGIPYTTLLLNSINHPDARGMRIFADALMELFP